MQFQQQQQQRQMQMQNNQQAMAMYQGTPQMHMVPGVQQGMVPQQQMVMAHRNMGQHLQQNLQPMFTSQSNGGALSSEYMNTQQFVMNSSGGQPQMVHYLPSYQQTFQMTAPHLDHSPAQNLDNSSFSDFSHSNRGFLPKAEMIHIQKFPSQQIINDGGNLKQNQMNFYRRFKKIQNRTPEKENHQENVTRFDKQNHKRGQPTLLKQPVLQAAPPTISYPQGLINGQEELLQHYNHIQEVREMSSASESEYDSVPRTYQFNNARYYTTNQSIKSTNQIVGKECNLPDGIFNLEQVHNRHKSFQETIPKNFHGQQYQQFAHAPMNVPMPLSVETQPSAQEYGAQYQINPNTQLSQPPSVKALFHDQFYHLKAPHTQTVSEIHTPLPANKIDKQTSEINYSANKQVRFTDFQAKENYSDNIAHRKSASKTSSILANSARKKTSPAPNRKNLTSQREKAGIYTKRSKSIKSGLSVLSSLSSCSRSQRPLKSAKSNSRSIIRQQEQEYDKLSAKKPRRFAENIARLEKQLKGNLSYKKSLSKRPKSLSLVHGKTKKQTILIDAEGLSEIQMKQIERVTRILNGRLSPMKRSVLDLKMKTSAKNSDNSRISRDKTPPNRTPTRLQKNSKLNETIDSKKKQRKASGSRSISRKREHKEIMHRLQKEPKRDDSRNFIERNQRNQNVTTQAYPGMNLYNSYGEPVAIVPYHHPRLGHQQQPSAPQINPQFSQSQLQSNTHQSYRNFPSYDHTQPKYSIDHSIENNTISHDLGSDQRRMIQSRSGQILDENGFPIQSNMHNFNRQLHYQSPMYMNQLRTIQETKSPEEQQSLGDLNERIQSHHTIQPMSGDNTIVSPSNLMSHLQEPVLFRQPTQPTEREYPSQVPASAPFLSQIDENENVRDDQEIRIVERNQTFNDSHMGNTGISIERPAIEVLDSLSQMQDQENEAVLPQRLNASRYKSYNNNDINDVRQELEQLQHAEPTNVSEAQLLSQTGYKKISEDQSVVTNSNTMTTYPTNHAIPQNQNAAILSKRTVGTDNLNVQMHNRCSTNHCDVSEGGEYTRRVIGSSTTSNLNYYDGQVLNYVTDNNSYARHQVHEQPQSVSQNPLASQKYSEIIQSIPKSRNDSVNSRQRPESNKLNNNFTQNTNLIDRMQNSSRNTNMNDNSMLNDDPMVERNAKFISFNDSQQITKNGQINTHGMNIVTNASNGVDFENLHSHNDHAVHMDIQQNNSIPVSINSQGQSMLMQNQYYEQAPPLTYNSNSPMIHSNQMQSPVGESQGANYMIPQGYYVPQGYPQMMPPGPQYFNHNGMLMPMHDQMMQQPQQYQMQQPQTHLPDLTPTRMPQKSDILQSYASSDYFTHPIMNIQNSFEPKTPQSKKKISSKQFKESAIKKSVKKSKHKSKNASLSLEPNKNIIAFKFFNNKKVHNRSRTRNNDEFGGSIISKKSNKSAIISHQRSLLDQQSSITTSRMKPVNGIKKKKKSKERGDNTSLSKKSNRSKTSKKNVSKLCSKEKLAKSKSKSPLPQIRPIYAGPLQLNDGKYQVILLQDFNKEGSQIIDPRNFLMDNFNQNLLSEPLSLQRTMSMGNQISNTTQTNENQYQIMQKNLDSTMTNIQSIGVQNEQNQSINGSQQSIPQYLQMDFKGQTGKQEVPIKSNQFLINEQSENPTQVTQQNEDLNHQSSKQLASEVTMLQHNNYNRTIQPDEGQAFLYSNQSRQELPHLATQGNIANPDLDSLPRTEVNSSVMMQQIQGINGIRLIYDPETQKIYQQQSNGSLILSDMQFLDTRRQSKGPATSTLSQRTAKHMKNLETPTFLEQSFVGMGQFSKFRRSKAQNEILMNSQAVQNAIQQRLVLDNLNQQYHDLQDQMPGQHYMTKSAQNEVMSSNFNESNQAGILNSRNRSSMKKKKSKSVSATPIPYRDSDDIRVSKKSSMLPTKRLKNHKNSVDSGSTKLTNIILPLDCKTHEFKKAKRGRSKRSRSKKSKKSSKSQKYKMSIDRIVSKDRKNNEIIDRLSLPKNMSYPRIQKVNSNSLLPSRKVITPMKVRKTTQTPVGRKIKAIVAKLKFNNQLRSVDRLHNSRIYDENLKKELEVESSSHPRPKSWNKSWLVTPKAKSRMSRHSQSKMSRVRTPNPKHSIKNSFPGLVNISSQGSNTKFQAYRQHLKSLERAKYDKMLEKQKSMFVNQIKDLNTNSNNRMSYMRRSLDYEKQKAYQLKESIEEIEKNAPLEKKERVKKLQEKMLNEQKTLKRRKFRSKSRSRSRSKASIKSKSRKAKFQLNDASRNNTNYIYKPEEILGTTNGIMSESINSNQQNNGVFSSSQKNSMDNPYIKTTGFCDETRGSDKDKFIGVSFNNKPVPASIMLKTTSDDNKDLIQRQSILSSQSTKSRLSKQLDSQKNLFMSRLKGAQSSIEIIQPNSNYQLSQNDLRSPQNSQPFSSLNQPDNEKNITTLMTEMTQTSASSSVWPEEKWSSVTQMFKKNQKQIKRIENILYKKDKLAPKKNRLLESSSKYADFRDKINTLHDKKMSMKIQPGDNSMVQIDYSKESERSHKHTKTEQLLMDVLSVGKALKMDKIEKTTKMQRESKHVR